MSSRTYSSRCRVALRSAERQEGSISFNSQPWAHRPAQMAMNPVRLRLTVQRDQAYIFIVPRIGFCRTRWLFELRGCGSLIEAVRGNLRANRLDSYTRPLRVRVPRCSVRVREEARTKHWASSHTVNAGYKNFSCF
jgi:hypothetical protein